VFENLQQISRDRDRIDGFFLIQVPSELEAARGAPVVQALDEVRCEKLGSMSP
jgi:hypothetical protein